jgi:hypothetical protein
VPDADGGEAGGKIGSESTTEYSKGVTTSTKAENTKVSDRFCDKLSCNEKTTANFWVWQMVSYRSGKQTTVEFGDGGIWRRGSKGAPKCPWHTCKDRDCSVCLQSGEKPDVTSDDDKTETTTKASAETVTTTKAGAETVTTTKAGAETVTTTKAGAETVTTTKAGAKTDTTTKAGAKTDTTTKAGAETVTTTKAGAETVTTTKAGAETVTTTKAGAKTDTTTKAGAKTVTTTTTKVGAKP